MIFVSKISIRNVICFVKGENMPGYFNDLKFILVAHRFFIYSSANFFITENNSLEFIRSGHIILKRQNGLEIELSAPAFFWMKENSSCRFIVPNEKYHDKYIEHIYLDFNGERSRRMLSSLDELYPAGVFRPRNPEEVSDTFFRILKLYRGNPVSNHAGMGMLTEKLMFLAYDSFPHRQENSKDSYGLEQIAEKLRSEPFEDYDFHAIATELDISIDHFRRIFREKHKITPAAYLHHQRMFRAAELLKTTNMRIKEIVISCKFKSDIDFSRSFKKFSGLSPRIYREQYGKPAVNVPRVNKP